MQSVRGKIGAALGGCLLIGALAFVLGTRCTPVVTQGSLVDSLQAVNGMLAQQRQALGAKETALGQVQATLQQVRDSAQRATAHVTQQLDSARKALPPAASAPDTALRGLYALALVRLDTALSLLHQKDSIIVQDDSLQKLAAWRMVDLHATIALDSVQLANETRIAAAWQSKYEATQKPRCGRKCGVVIGVLGTVGVAIAAEKVKTLIQPSPAARSRAPRTLALIRIPLR